MSMIKRIQNRPSTFPFKEKLLYGGCLCVCIACFFTPLSTSLTAIFSGIAFLTWIFSGRFQNLIQILKTYPAASIALFLFLFMCLAVMYSPAEPLEAIETLKKYRELVLLPVMISLLTYSFRFCRAAELSFVSGCTALMIISYLIAFNIIPEARYGNSIVFHITHNFFMAVLSFWALHFAVDSGKLKPLWLLLFTAASINIFYIAPGRTGMLVFICLIILFIIQRFSFKKSAVSFLVFCSLVSGFYFTSDNFSGRVHEAVKEIQTYQPGKSRTSIGQRFDWWVASISLIKQKPFFGYGTGSYPYLLSNAASKSQIKETDNPHNEYLFLSVQFGLVGLLLFLLMIFLQLAETLTFRNQRERMLLQGVVLAILSGSLINSLLFDSQQGHFYLFLSAALMASQKPLEESSIHTTIP